MSLNNSQMLPARVRNMRQMNDVLNAEDIILAEIERIIDEMYQRASLLHEELVNEAWLEKRLEVLTKGIVTVEKVKDVLQVNIGIDIGSQSSLIEEQVVNFINKWLPAHLAYSIYYNKILCSKMYLPVIWQNDEIITIRQVIL